MQLSLDNGPPPLDRVKQRADAIILGPSGPSRKTLHLCSVTLAEAVYGAALATARGAAPLAARFSPALARAVAERGANAVAFAAWGRDHRDRTRPLVVFHGASAGELRQAEPVLRRVRHRHPEWQLAVTCFSPSGLPVARSLPADTSGLSPLDLTDEVEAFLDALDPTVLVVTKLDLWPTLARIAAARGVRLGLIAGRVRPGSGRLSWAARLVLKPAYRKLDLVGAAGTDDATRLRSLGTRPEVTRVIGDPRHDAVLERIAGRPAPTPHAATLIAGSTWPRDEKLLVEVLARLRRAGIDARLVIAPHEPAPRTMARLTAWATTQGLAPPRPLAQASAADPLVITEEVGDLAFLYGTGVIAYVGGGFRPGGLHSVLEPAAWRVPVIAGPDAATNPDAVALLEAGGLIRLPYRNADSALEACWRTWLLQPERRSVAGEGARRALELGTGAADRSAELVEALVTGERHDSA